MKKLLIIFLLFAVVLSFSPLYLAERHYDQNGNFTHSTPIFPTFDLSLMRDPSNCETNEQVPRDSILNLVGIEVFKCKFPKEEEL